MFFVWLPVLLFLKLKRIPGKVRNKSETSQKYQKNSTYLASIHRSSSFLIIATSIITRITTITTTSITSTNTSISSTSNYFTLTITNSVSRLAARTTFFEVKENTGKGQK